MCKLAAHKSLQEGKHPPRRRPVRARTVCAPLAFPSDVIRLCRKGEAARRRADKKKSAAVGAEKELKVQIKEINLPDLRESKKMLSCPLGAHDCR